MSNRESGVGSQKSYWFLEDVLKVQMLVALATEVAATQTKPAAAGS
jgi:hypothetical protein